MTRQSTRARRARSVRRAKLIEAALRAQADERGWPRGVRYGDRRRAPRCPEAHRPEPDHRSRWSGHPKGVPMHLPTAIRRTAIGVALAALLVGAPALAQADDCASFDRTIVFAELGYGSADIMTDIARFVLDEGFGCTTDALPGATLPILQGMIRGDIDVDMEVWVDNTPEFWHRGGRSGQRARAEPRLRRRRPGLLRPPLPGRGRRRARDRAAGARPAQRLRPAALRRPVPRPRAARQGAASTTASSAGTARASTT